MGPKENEDFWVGGLATLREERRSNERLLGKSIEGNSNLVSMVGERGGEIF